MKALTCLVPAAAAIAVAAFAASGGDGRFVYVQTGKPGIVDEFAVGAGGALTPIGSVTVPGGPAASESRQPEVA